MNREKIEDAIRDCYHKRCSMGECLDKIEAESKREHGEIPGKPEIPESVKGYLELLQKRADYQVATNVEQAEIAKWILDNLRDEVKPKKKKEWHAWVCVHVVDGRIQIFMENCVDGPEWKMIRKISGEEAV